MTPIEKVRAALKAAHLEISAQLVKEGWTYKDIYNYGTLRKIEEALRELDGMVLVPVEPTEEMLKCACNTDLSNIGYASPVGLRITPEMFIEDCYKAMIAKYLPEEKQNDR